MIHSLTIKNFLSFKEEMTYSFVATKDHDKEDYHVVEMADGVRLLKFGVVYGANASGKSNLIDAFSFLSHFWKALPKRRDVGTGVMPFLFDPDSENGPSEFKLIFYIEDQKYVYELKLSNNEVLLEKLSYYPSNQPAKIFERSLENGESVISFAKNISIKKNAKEAIQLNCLPNTSFFVAYYQVNLYIEKLSNVISSISNLIMPGVNPSVNLRSYTAENINENEALKTKVTSFLNTADLNVSGIILNKLNEDFIQSVKDNTNISEEELKRMRSKNELLTYFEQKITKDEIDFFVKVPIDIQSDGTKRMFGLAGPIINTISNNSLLCIDEIESKLHPHLIEYIIGYFLENSTNAQLLVATHYDNLFEQEDLLRKDNFWFVEKNQAGSTELYPLADFNGLNRITSLQKAYKLGRFGAIPNLD